jgi:hypothetical protein
MKIATPLAYPVASAGPPTGRGKTQMAPGPDHVVDLANRRFAGTTRAQLDDLFVRSEEDTRCDRLLVHMGTGTGPAAMEGA